MAGSAPRPVNRCAEAGRSRRRRRRRGRPWPRIRQQPPSRWQIDLRHPLAPLPRGLAPEKVGGDQVEPVGLLEGAGHDRSRRQVGRVLDQRADVLGPEPPGRSVQARADPAAVVAELVAAQAAPPIPQQRLRLPHGEGRQSAGRPRPQLGGPLLHEEADQHSDFVGVEAEVGHLAARSRPWSRGSDRHRRCQVGAQPLLSNPLAFQREVRCARDVFQRFRMVVAAGAPQGCEEEPAFGPARVRVAGAGGAEGVVDAAQLDLVGGEERQGQALPLVELVGRHSGRRDLGPHAPGIGHVAKDVGRRERDRVGAQRRSSLADCVAARHPGVAGSASQGLGQLDAGARLEHRRLSRPQERRRCRREAHAQPPAPLGRGAHGPGSEEQGQGQPIGDEPRQDGEEGPEEPEA